MAKLIDTQKMCDKKKYLESEKLGKDMSGSMDYCTKCEYSKSVGSCVMPHEERVRTNACARAYKRLHKTK